ncbi:MULTISPECIES: adenylate kinase family protein [unclassified Candidatus Frackibacter]|uniref:adenylate kinase family protein n=1 Tax=unclassified Candidatus Frackibacter TaxID=2648818 RepID=UPI0008863EDD|nr:MULTISPECIES: nucleoside monophosphate kinase [unclassified Candidatus Frackibacter]SDC82970.1 Adenylate kinase [Candidatus Frackibacter sp. WG11]SEM97445.1 Adenylate kinase [Candidatus Frackibacter sp. WG12]SFM06195.1 Adenylate kinase [Candidatus Frackibacter sp. WG13]
MSKQLFLNEDIKINVNQVSIEGKGVILLTGPSGCGKGEISKALCKFLAIPKTRRLSMGNILRMTISKAKQDKEFKLILADKYDINDKTSIFNLNKNKPETIKEVHKHKEKLITYLRSNNNFISQFDWLEFCVNSGLLVPDKWTKKIIKALLENSLDLRNQITILDGYPRTIVAAKHLLKTFEKLNIPIIKVLHLFISKEQMKARTLNRKRADDTKENLERRYQFYIDKVQPCVDYLKYYLGTEKVALIDAHQPIFDSNKQIDIDASIHQVVLSVIQALELPKVNYAGQSVIID